MLIVVGLSDIGRGLALGTGHGSAELGELRKQNVIVSFNHATARFMYSWGNICGCRHCDLVDLGLLLVPLIDIHCALYTSRAAQNMFEQKSVTVEDIYRVSGASATFFETMSSGFFLPATKPSCQIHIPRANLPCSPFAIIP